ncbi:MAG: ParA family protein [Betaproteobacteria bacterium]|nr:ParA family protein [Betaproteobacteria bacterium]
MPGLRIAVANQKGGTGKTTLALNLAAGLQRRGSTLVLDADPQASISQWAAIGDARGHLPAVHAVAQDDVPGRIAAGMRGHRYVVIDCPPTLQTATVGDVLNSVDVLLVPIQPSPVDLWASVDITAAVRDSRRRNPRLKAFAVLNQLDTRNALSRAMHEALAELEFPTLRAGLARRAAYRSAAVEGTSVYGLGHRGKAAAHEVEALIEELLQS